MEQITAGAGMGTRLPVGHTIERTARKVQLSAERGVSGRACTDQAVARTSSSTPFHEQLAGNRHAARPLLQQNRLPVSHS